MLGVIRLGREVARYAYRDEHGEHLYDVVRFADPKDFRIRRPNGAWGLGGTRRVLYRLPELLAADPAGPVFVVEGEKDADRLAGLGLVATTNSEGAGNWRPEHDYSRHLAGRWVVIVPDNDDPGRAHARSVREQLAGVADVVRILELPGERAKGADVSDWLDAGGTRERLLELLREPEPEQPPEPSTADRLGARRLTAISTDPAPPLRLGRLDAEGPTILFGTGGSMKGLTASWWCVCLVREDERVLILDYEGHPTEWARRVHGLGSEAAAGIVHASPLSAAWTGKRGPLWEQADEIRLLVAETGATYLVVDSLVPACAGADPLKAETAALYTGGLQAIGLPSLSLAHVTKADGDLRYPYGSVLWHAFARVTWSLKREGDGAILQNRKANNHRGGGRFVISVDWLDDLPRNVTETGYSLALADRIDEVLGDRAMTRDAIVDALNDEREEGEEAVKTDSVAKVLKRGLTATAKAPQRYTVEDGLWRRVTS